MNKVEVEIRELMHTRYNVVTGRIEFKNLGEEGFFKAMDDYKLVSLLRRVKKVKKTISKNALVDIISSDFSKQYDPFKEYFKSLPTYDRGIDFIAQYCKLAKVDNPIMFRKYFTKWLVATVADAIVHSENNSNQQVLVLTGGQGIGKTTFLNKLVPIPLKDYSYTGFVNPSNKDTLIHVSECMLIVMDEMTSLNNKNLDALKQLVTQKSIRIRRPYGRFSDKLMKRSSFAGTTNDDQFLIDATGNRRWLCFKVHDIDLSAVATFNIDGLMSQAYYLLNNGFQYWLSKDENKELEEMNKQFVVVDYVQELIMQHFKLPKQGDSLLIARSLTATEIMELFASKGKMLANNSNLQKIGKALKALGYVQRISGGNRIYDITLNN